MKNPEQRIDLLGELLEDLRGEQSYSQILNNMQAAVLQLDGEGRVTWCNNAWSRLSGYTQDETLGKHISEDLLRTNRNSDSLIPVVNNATRTDCILTCKNGTALCVDYSASSSSDTTTVSLFDVTKRCESERQRAMLDRARSNFYSVISHDLRAPLTTIISTVKAVQNMEDDVNMGLTRIEAQSRYLLMMLDEVIEYSKVEADDIRIRVRAFNLHDFLKDEIYNLQSTAKEKNLRLDYAIEPDTPIYIETDDNKLGKILQNIVGYAIKHAEEGKVTVNLGAQTDGKHCKLIWAIKDSGPGISPDRAERLFKPYEQIEGKAGSVGLGLAICERLVRSLGGEIIVNSGPNGNEMIFHITALIPETAQEEHRQRGKIPPVKANILIVEDSRLESLLLRTFLKKAGVIDENIYYAESLHETKEMLSKDVHFDVAFVDVMLEDGDGEDAAMLITSASIDTYIVACTASTDDSDYEKMTNAGASDYIIKPATKDAIDNVLAKLNDI